MFVSHKCCDLVLQSDLLILTHHCIVIKRKNVVFRRCQTEFQQRDVAVRGDGETQKKLHSFVLFLGELYLNLEVGCCLSDSFRLSYLKMYKCIYLIIM